jgi:tetratricopeptide (TPR) repeat protein
MPPSSTIRPPTAVRRACIALLLAAHVPAPAHAQSRTTRPAAPDAAALLDRCTSIPDAASCRAVLRRSITDRQRSLALTYLVEAGEEARDSLLQQAVKRDSTNALARYLLGIAWFQRRDGLPHLAAALRLRPDWTFVHRRMAESYRPYDNGRELPGGPDSAAMLWRRAADMEPDVAFVQVQLGEALLYAGHRAEAEAAFRRAVALESERPTAVAGLCHALLVQEKTAEAQAPCRRAIRGWNGSHGIDIRNLSTFAENAKDYALALAATEQGLVDEPLSRFHRSDRTRLLDLMGRRPDAIRRLREWVTAHPSDWEAVGELADILYHEGQLAEARTLYQRTLAPACGQSWAGCMERGRLATTSLRLGRLDDALRELRATLEVQADCPYVLPEFERWVAQRPDSVAVRARYRGMLADFGDWAAKNKPAEDAASFFATTGEWARAAALFEVALDSVVAKERAEASAGQRVYSNAPNMRWRHGEALVGLGRPCAGLRELEAAIAENAALATQQIYIPDVLAKARAECREGRQ